MKRGIVQLSGFEYEIFVVESPADVAGSPDDWGWMVYDAEEYDFYLEMPATLEAAKSLSPEAILAIGVKKI